MSLLTEDEALIKFAKTTIALLQVDEWTLHSNKKWAFDTINRIREYAQHLGLADTTIDGNFQSLVLEHETDNGVKTNEA